MTGQGRRGRPMDPAVGAAALQAALELLDEHGYGGLRVDDVAARAGIGLGALYRRWSTKAELVKAALLSAAAEQHIEETADPGRDLLHGLIALNSALAGRGGRFLALLFAGTEPELSVAIRETKIVPLREANRRRARRALAGAGLEVEEVDRRADAAVGLILLHFMAHGEPMTTQQVLERALPAITGSAGTVQGDARQAEGDRGSVGAAWHPSSWTP